MDESEWTPLSIHWSVVGDGFLQPHQLTEEFGLIRSDEDGVVTIFMDAAVRDCSGLFLEQGLLVSPQL